MLHKGRQLTNGSVTQAGLSKNSTITVIRSSAASVDAVRSLREDTLLRGIAANKQPRFTAVPAPSAKRPSLFGDTRALPQYANWQDALAILDELATHPGFHAAMSKRHWHVGLLAEMPPTGRVGVDPVCVLGYNVNKGMEIHLRLRTDDELGFRPMHKLYEVLAHELAHCEHSDHGEEFKQLMLDVQREAEEGDWRYSTGRVLGDGGYVRNSVPGSRRRLAEVRPAPRAASAARSRLIREHERRRVQRGRTEEKSGEVGSEKTDTVDVHNGGCCGGSHHHGSHDEQKTNNDMDTSTDQANTVEPQSKEDAVMGTPGDPVVSVEQTPTVAPEEKPVLRTPPVRRDSQQLSTLLAMGVQRELAIIALRMCKNEVNAAVDYALSPPSPNFGPLESTALAAELRDLLDVLCTEIPTQEDCLRTLQTLHTYINNVVQSPGNPRYRSINAANSAFIAFVASHPSALNYLGKSGFELDFTTNRWLAQDKVSLHILSAALILERLLSFVQLLT